jgi:hypothetical protein
MSVSTSPNVTIGPGVQEFLRQNDAETAFQTICELIRERFPETLSVEADLQEDHDEPGWRRVYIFFTLPADCSADRAWAQNRLLLERLMERVPFAQVPLFIAQYTFAAE